MACLTLASERALADKRAALVIGNSLYQNVPSLANPINDAREIAALFKSAGFQHVDTRINLGIADFRRAVREFSEAARDVDVAVIYFAGHGMEVDGANVLVPVDAKLAQDFDIEDETVSLDRVLRAIEPAKRLRLVILDACRDNPFLKTMKRSVASRSVGRGLAKIEPGTSDTLIAFAAKAGSVALDGNAQNSPFTGALLNNIAAPGLDLRIAFGRVRDEVLKATERRQEPFVYGSLGGSIVSIVDAPAAPLPPPPADEIVWNAIRNADSPAIFADFIEKFPASSHRAAAEARRNELQKRAAEQAKANATDEIVWNAIKDSEHAPTFADFVVKFPTSPHRSKAEARHAELQKRAELAAKANATDEIVWNAIKDSDHAPTFADFVTRFPKSPHRAQAEARRSELQKRADAEAKANATDEIVWNAIRDSDHAPAFADFVAKFPNSQHRAKAEARRNELQRQRDATARANATDEVIWNAIKDANYPAIFADFVTKFPASPHRSRAEGRRSELEKRAADKAAAVARASATDEVVWVAIKDSTYSAIFADFAAKFPTSVHRAEADDKRARLQKQEDAAARANATDEVVWSAIRDSDYAPTFADFVTKFPDSRHRPAAEARRDDLQQRVAAAAAAAAKAASTDEIVWSAIKDADHPAIFADFVTKFPNSQRRGLAELRRDELQKRVAVVERANATDEVVWNAIKDAGHAQTFADFAAKFPASQHRPKAEARRDELQKQAAQAAAAAARAAAADEIVWDAIRNAQHQAVFEQFLSQFPGSPRAAAARERLDELNKIAVAAVNVPASQFATDVKTSLSAGRINIGLKVLSEVEETALKQKASFRECDKCPELVAVPPGKFAMGSTDHEASREAIEGPQHQVTIGRPFAVGRFAVTFDEWDTCVADGGCNGYKPWDNGWGRGKRPVINVSWHDAQSYVAWLSGRTGKQYRLLSEAEREYVTRAGTTTPYWWGASVSRKNANFNDKPANDKRGPLTSKTSPVESFTANAWGLFQVSGNVWEWADDCYVENYNGAPSDGSSRQKDGCEARVLRGGSWISQGQLLRSAARYGVRSDGRVSNVGFRIARTLAQ